MRKMVSVASIMAFALTCSQPKPTNFKPSMQEGVMTDAKTLPMPFKQTRTFDNGSTMWETGKNVIIRDESGNIIAKGTFIRKLPSGDVVFKTSSGEEVRTDKTGFLVPLPIPILNNGISPSGKRIH